MNRRQVSGAAAAPSLELLRSLSARRRAADQPRRCNEMDSLHLHFEGKYLVRGGAAPRPPVEQPRCI